MIKLPIKSLIILIFITKSIFIFAALTPADTLHTNEVKQGSNIQKALFHPVVIFFQNGSDNPDTNGLQLIEKLISDTKN